MSISLYDATVASYLQTLGGVANVLDKGEAYAAENGIELQDIVNHRLRDDMAPFSFQVISVWHHSKGAVQGLKDGLFTPPPPMSDMYYTKVKGLVAEAIDSLQQESREEIDALADKPLTFRLDRSNIPFTTNNFILSFSLPNFYFHSTTTYAVLRILEVPLGKMDYLGALRLAG